MRIASSSSSRSVLRASVVAAVMAAWLASTALAMPQIMDREDPPQSPPEPFAMTATDQIPSSIGGGQGVEGLGPPPPAASSSSSSSPASSSPSKTTISPPPKPAGEEAKPRVPITVQLFASSPGVKTCRGGSASKLVDMRLPANASVDARFAAPRGQCYDLPGTAQCGIFTGNKADGCEALLFRGERCGAGFTNIAVFQEELRAVGGFFASMSIRCGVVPAEPKPLSLGGLGAKLQPAKGKGEKRRRRRGTVDAGMRAG